MLVQLVFSDPACEAAYEEYANASSTRLDTVGLLLQLICCLTCFSNALRGSAPASTTAQLALATSAIAILTLSAVVCVHRNRAAWPARRRLVLPLLRILRFAFILYTILVFHAVPPCLPSDPPTPTAGPPVHPHSAHSHLHLLVPITGHTLMYSLVLRLPDPLHASLALLEAATLSTLLSPTISSLLPPATAAPAFHHLSTLTELLRPPVPRLAPIPPTFRPPPASTPSLLLHFLSPSLLLLSCLLTYLSHCYHRAAFAHTLPPHKLTSLYLHLLPRTFLAVVLVASFLPVVHDSCVLLHTFPPTAPATWLLVGTICILEAFMRLWVWVLLFGSLPAAARRLLAAPRLPPHLPPHLPPGSDEVVHALAPSETSSGDPSDPPAAPAAASSAGVSLPAAAAAAAAGPSGVGEGRAGGCGGAKANGGCPKRSDIRRCSDAFAAAPEGGSLVSPRISTTQGGPGR